MKASTYSAETLQLLNALGARPIAYHPAFARAWGVKAAILLGQLIYWHGKQANPDGWIRKTVAEIEEETALSENEQETARRGLIAAGAVEFKRMGVPAMPYYRINHDAILDALTSKSAEQDSAKRPNQLGQNVLSSQAGYRGNLIGGNQLSVQETTTENTAETTTGEEGAGAPPPNFDALARTAGIHNQPAPKRKPRKSPANITESNDLRIAAYLELCRSEITPSNAEIITARIQPEWVAHWRETCRDYAVNAWNVNRIGDMCERCERKANAARVRALQGDAPATSSQLTGAARIAQETFDRQQRANARALEYLKRQEGGNVHA
jgi:hypothetical protein